MGHKMDKVASIAGGLVDTAAKTTNGIIEKSKEQIQLQKLKNQMANTQKQLGSLVYMLQKTGQSNDAMIEEYVAELDRINRKMAELKKPKTTIYTVNFCTECGVEVEEDAMFCSSCGAEFSQEPCADCDREAKKEAETVENTQEEL